MLLVNAEVDSMGGGIDDRLGIISTLSMQKSSDLEKTQSELRQKFTAAERFRRELEFLQKGGDPLDLITGSAASVSVQSTSLTDQHPEQFVTSEAKGSFAVTASPHGDSVGSSGRLGAPSVCEPNSADNLVLFDGENKSPKVERRSVASSEHYSRLDLGQNVRGSGDSAALELPKKSYKRRIRSRPNRDGALERKGPSSVNLDLKGSNDTVAIKSLVSSSRLDPELDGALAVETTQVISAKGLDSESSCTQKGQNLDVNNENELTTSPKNINCNGTVEQSLTSNEVLGEEGSNMVKENDCKILNTANNNSDLCHRSHNVDGFVVKEEEGLKGSESAKGAELDGSTALETERKPSDVLESTLSVVDPTDISDQSVYSQNNSNLATKEHEDSILKEAQIIEAKRETIAGLSVSRLSLQNHKKSRWDFVLEEMSWLANDFAQERLWKITAAAQISRRVAFTSQIRYQQQKSLWKQKEVAQTLGRAVIDFWHTIEVKYKNLELQCPKTDSKQGLQGYITRFLEYNSIYVQSSTAQVPPNPEMISDVNITDATWDNSLTEENLVYMVPLGAIEAYRKSIENHLQPSERTWSGMQEEMDTSGYDAVADNALDEHDGETRAYYLPGVFEGSKALQATKKRRNNFKFHTARPYETRADFPCMEKNIETQPYALNGNRPHNNLNVSLPTNHVRTASRQRVLGPFSGDSNSFQDEQSTLHGGAQIPNSMEAESAGDCEKQLQFDSVGESDRPRKKKKHKHSQGSSFDHQWRLDSNFQNDQKNHSRKRLDAQQLDINGGNGLYIQHNLKKLKIRQSSDNSFDDPTHLARSIPSPVTSQMSNMSNPKKFMELLVRDRVRKSKNHKTSAGQPGSGSSWSLFEDQFLVVLVHDMGPNWELISDAINSSLQIKCIFRSTKECKERHKILMDRSTGDGADSADDSGSSQPYPSTLRGIPEGSARQLFQRLQGPMEEETLKSHFEKIIKIGQKQHYKRKQSHNQDPKQLQQPHSSYTFALSQVSPNNLNGGPVLTPLELCDATVSTPDVPPVGYQGSHNCGLPITDQGSGVTMLPGSNSNSSVPYSSNLTPGNELSSASVPHNPSVRDGRFGVLKTGSLQKDDQQRMQQYNQLLAARNLQHSTGSHSGIGRGVRVGPAGNNNIGVMPGGMNRGMTMARPTFHGVASPSMMNPANMHLMRPNQNTDHQGQIVHPALGMRIVKERQPQQRVPQQPQQFATSNPMMPHLQVQVSQPVLPPSVKHPLLLSPTHGVGRNPKTCGNQILNQQRQSQQFQQTKPIKGGAKSSDNNSNHQSHGPSLVATTSSMMTSRPPTHQKLMNLSKVTTSQNMVNNRLVNSSEPPTSKLHISPPQTSSAGATS